MGNTKNKKRVLVVSIAIILLCMTIVVGVAFALFTDYRNIKNHLKAGNLALGLKRTYLEYSVLNDLGKPAITKSDVDVDFTTANDKNLLGMDSKTSVLIVPESYFYAELELTNNGNVAFTYTVSIQLNGNVNDLAEQLEVTFIDNNNKETTKMLSELTNGLVIGSGEMTTKDKAHTFSVKVKFVDDIDYNKPLPAGSEDRIYNNLAMGQSAIVDIVVSAVQVTTIATTASTTQPVAP